MEHPGVISFFEMPGEVSGKYATEDLPREEIFVFLKNGAEVQTESAADEALPILSVERQYYDKNMKMVPRKIATQFKLMEFGPQNRLLRTRLLKII